MDLINQPQSNLPLTTMLNNLGNLALSNRLRYLHLHQPEISVVVEALKEYISQCDLATIQQTQNFTAVRAHRLHNLKNIFERTVNALEKTTGDTVFHRDNPVDGYDTYQLISYINHNPTYRIVVASLLAIDATLRDLNDYKRDRSFAGHMNDADDLKRLEDSISYKQELIGPEGTLVTHRVVNLFNYYYSVLSVSPDTYIAITNNPDDLCKACPVKALGLKIGPHCVKTDTHVATEDDLIIRELVMQKLTYENLQNFLTEQGVIPQTEVQKMGSEDRIQFAADLLVKAINVQSRLYPTDFETWISSVIAWLRDSGIGYRLKEQLLAALESRIWLTEVQKAVIDRITYNTYAGANKAINKDIFDAVRIETTVDDNYQFVNSVSVYAKQWLLFDEAFALALDVTESRHFF